MFRSRFFAFPFLLMFSCNLQSGSNENLTITNDVSLLTVKEDRPFSINQQAIELIKSVAFPAFITQDSAGFSKVRTMDALQPDSTFVVYLATNPLSRKVDEIKTNNKVSLYYAHPEGLGYVSIYGQATLLHPTKDKSIWKEEWSQFYPNYPHDCILIKIQPLKVEMIHTGYQVDGNKTTWAPLVFYPKK